MFWSTTSTGRRASSPTRLLGLLVAPLLLAACVTPLTSSQRQQLETKTYEAGYEATFFACRDAFVNFGYGIEESDFDGGILVLSSEVLRHNPNTALGLSIAAPPAGDFYMQRYAWGIFDLLLWPWSIAWAAPSNYHLAKTRKNEIEGTVALQELKPDRARVRISLKGIDWDTTKYPELIRSLQEEIERQLFIKAGDTLANEPQ